jgi:hypothetical protein
LISSKLACEQGDFRARSQRKQLEKSHMKNSQIEPPPWIKDAVWVSRQSNPIPHPIARKRGWDETRISRLSDTFHIFGQTEPIYTFEGMILANYELAQACLTEQDGFWAIEWKPTDEGENPSEFLLQQTANGAVNSALKRAWDGFVLLPLFEEQAKTRQGKRTDLKDGGEPSTKIGESLEAMKAVANLVRSNHEYIRQIRNTLKKAVELAEGEAKDTSLFDWACDAANKNEWSLREFLEKYKGKEKEVLGAEAESSENESTGDKPAGNETILGGEADENKPVSGHVQAQQTGANNSGETKKADKRKKQTKDIKSAPPKPPVNVLSVTKGDDEVFRIDLENGEPDIEAFAFEESRTEVEIVIGFLRAISTAPTQKKAKLTTPSGKSKDVYHYNFAPEAFAAAPQSIIRALCDELDSATVRAWNEATAKLAVQQISNSDIQ